MKFKCHFLGFVALLLLAIISCNNTKKENINEKYNDIHLIPDSLWTPDQKEFIKSLTRVIHENIVIENNHMKFKLTKKEFEEKGFSEYYYNLIQKNIEDNNHLIDNEKVEGFDEIFKESKREVLKSLESEDSSSIVLPD